MWSSQENFLKGGKMNCKENATEIKAYQYYRTVLLSPVHDPKPETSNFNKQLTISQPATWYLYLQMLHGWKHWNKVEHSSTTGWERPGFNIQNPLIKPEIYLNVTVTPRSRPIVVYKTVVLLSPFSSLWFPFPASITKSIPN